MVRSTVLDPHVVRCPPAPTEEAREWGGEISSPRRQCHDGTNYPPFYESVLRTYWGNLMVLPKLAVAVVILVHNWYPKECCSGDEHSGDCHPIPCEEIIKLDSYGTTFAYKLRGWNFSGPMIPVRSTTNATSASTIFQRGGAVCRSVFSSKAGANVMSRINHRLAVCRLALRLTGLQVVNIATSG